MRFVKLINKHGLKGVINAQIKASVYVCELGPVVVITLMAHGILMFSYMM